MLLSGLAVFYIHSVRLEGWTDRRSKNLEFRKIWEFESKSGGHPAHQQPPDELCQSLQHWLPPDVLVNWEEQSQGQAQDS